MEESQQILREDFLRDWQNDESPQVDVKRPHDHLGWSLVNLLCLSILGVPALVYSIRTRDMLREGNTKKAEEYSRKSRLLNRIGTVVWAVLVAFTVIYVINSAITLSVRPRTGESQQRHDSFH